MWFRLIALASIAALPAACTTGGASTGSSDGASSSRLPSYELEDDAQASGDPVRQVAAAPEPSADEQAQRSSSRSEIDSRPAQEQTPPPIIDPPPGEQIAGPPLPSPLPTEAPRQRPQPKRASEQPAQPAPAEPIATPRRPGRDGRPQWWVHEPRWSESRLTACAEAMGESVLDARRNAVEAGLQRVRSLVDGDAPAAEVVIAAVRPLPVQAAAPSGMRYIGYVMVTVRTDEQGG